MCSCAYGLWNCAASFMVKGFAFSNPTLLVDVLLALVQPLFWAWVSRKYAQISMPCCRKRISLQAGHRSTTDVACYWPKRILRSS